MGSVQDHAPLSGSKFNIHGLESWSFTVPGCLWTVRLPSDAWKQECTNHSQLHCCLGQQKVGAKLVTGNVWCVHHLCCHHCDVFDWFWTGVRAFCISFIVQQPLIMLCFNWVVDPSGEFFYCLLENFTLTFALSWFEFALKWFQIFRARSFSFVHWYFLSLAQWC